MKINEPTNDVIFVKQNSNYIFAKEILEILHNYGCYRDEKFKELLTLLEQYVFSKIYFDDGLEIVDEYMVYECIKLP